MHGDRKIELEIRRQQLESSGSRVHRRERRGARRKAAKADRWQIR